MKVIIIYESTHHGNTKKLVDAITTAHAEVEAVNVSDAGTVSLEDYDLIGLAAGISFSKFYRETERFALTLPEGKKVFLLYTCGLLKDRYTCSMESTIAKRGCTLAGKYGCLGFDTYGPFKLIGGIAKRHPTQDEISAAVKFYEGISAQSGR